MEQEVFLSGYCRAVDGHRMVCVIVENGTVTESDCAYPDCPHAPVCPIAKEIEKA